MAIGSKMKNVPGYTKVLIIVVPSVLLIVLFFFLIYSPNAKTIKTLDKSISKLENEIATAEVKVSKLDELKAENEKLKKRLAELKEKMPEEKEVTALLKQISDLGLTSGLEILLWKPSPRQPDEEGIYVEIPVKVEVNGGYHDLGVFFSYISRFKRIVNISDMKLSLTLRKADKNLIKAVFTASTFSAVTAEDEEETGKKGKKGKKKKRRKKKKRK
jgi:type IV pilus assembly protein PilO